jgi:hypothetical protein
MKGYMDIKEIKRQIREAKKLKKDLRAGTTERIDLHRKIKQLQAQLDLTPEIDTDKELIIKEILKLDKNLSELVDLNKFSKEQLAFHLERLKEKKRSKNIQDFI